MSLPCSSIKAGPSFCRAFLSCGTMSERTRFLTGSFEAEVEPCKSMSNYRPSSVTDRVIMTIEKTYNILILLGVMSDFRNRNVTGYVLIIFAVP